jgi:hypothetical protein
MRDDKKRLTQVEFKPLFFPKDFVDMYDIERLDDWRLNENKVKAYAKDVTKLRKEIRVSA